MNIIVKATGEKITAQYITTASGNKRYSVHGKTYSDKQFDKLFAKCGEIEDRLIEWRVNTVGLLKELMDGYPSKGGIFFQPINIFKELLALVAQRAAELNDPVLNSLMCRLALYGESDPNSPDYNAEMLDNALTHPEYIKWRTSK